MATLFEAWLVGEDPEHLEATGHAALEEVVRVEALLSRFDPASEVARVNRDAARRPVRVDVELFGILADCLGWFERTDGYFDIVSPGRAAGAEGGTLPALVRLEAEERTVRFLAEGVRLDFGGYGKGYAVDRVARVLEAYGVEAALVHGGTSSVLARGERAEGTPWRVAVQDPFVEERGWDAARIRLRDAALSYSAVLGGRSPGSDIVDPHTGRPLTDQAACLVIALTGVASEVWSTALLAMGRERVESLVDEGRLTDGSVAWIGREGAETVVSWLHPSLAGG